MTTWERALKLAGKTLFLSACVGALASCGGGGREPSDVNARRNKSEEKQAESADSKPTVVETTGSDWLAGQKGIPQVIETTSASADPADQGASSDNAAIIVKNMPTIVETTTPEMMGGAMEASAEATTLVQTSSGNSGDTDVSQPTPDAIMAAEAPPPSNEPAPSMPVQDSGDMAPVAVAPAPTNEPAPSMPVQDSGDMAPVAVAPAPTPAETPIADLPLEEACSKGVKKERTFDVLFPADAKEVCPWGQGDNLSKKAGKIRARITHAVAAAVPKSHRICSFKAVSLDQDIKYEDHFFLNLNGYVITTRTAAISSLSKDETGFKTFNWPAIRDRPNDILSEPFCADGVTCSLPKKNELGTFSFSLNEGSQTRLLEKLQGKDLQFAIVLTGDDDGNRDCQLRTDLKISVKYRYVE